MPGPDTGAAMRRRLLMLSLLFVAGLAPAAVSADGVVASERVQSRLNVRAAAAGPVTASLRPGEEVTLVATRGDWHQIELPDGRVGFVATAWSRVVREPEPSPGPVTAHLHVERRGPLAAVGGFFRNVARW